MEFDESELCMFLIQSSSKFVYYRLPWVFFFKELRLYLMISKHKVCLDGAR